MQQRDIWKRLNLCSQKTRKERSVAKVSRQSWKTLEPRLNNLFLFNPRLIAGKIFGKWRIRGRGKSTKKLVDILSRWWACGICEGANRRSQKPGWILDNPTDKIKWWITTNKGYLLWRRREPLGKVDFEVLLELLDIVNITLWYRVPQWEGQTYRW